MAFRLGAAVGFGMALMAGSALAAPPGGQPPRTLNEALAAAYSNNPTLQAERAKLRATDENVPQALAGWRPTVVLSGTAGYVGGTTNEPTGFGGNTNVSASRDELNAQATVTQPIYSGGKVTAKTHQAKNQVRSERATLIATEQTVFQNVVNAYVGVIQAQQQLGLAINNQHVLNRQLQATQDRYHVGEITRTDVAQAEAALSGAVAQRQTAEGNLQIARATFRRQVGVLPGDLAAPQPLDVPVKSVAQATQLAAVNNPTVVAAQFTDAAAKDAIDVAFSALMPTLSVQASAFQQNNVSAAHISDSGGQVLATLSVPLYQGGSEYATVRQARQQELQSLHAVDDARRQAVQQAAQAWEALVAVRATIASTRSQIRANQIALDGVEREAIVGSRTTQDVLNAEQALLNSRVTLVQNLATLVTDSYTLAGAVGRLTARDLNLQVPLYDENAYYRAVHNAWFGTGDPTAGRRMTGGK
ncbi:MAG TPA: TolC family outer membrane protein [Acetobacteraceae bacterium]|nr:TolC family outer membrane protein [Acetobacteraceae bacterium]